MRKYHFLIALSVIALDRATKWTIARHLSFHDSIPVIPGFFRIIHAENPGAAFGIFADSPSQWKVALLIAFSIIALLIVSLLLWKNSHRLTTTGIGLALILGGAVGNLWDRLVSRHVVDFLLFYIGPHQWPAFNVADSAIVAGAGLLVFEIVFTKTPSHQSA
ncbi:MAG TPA: signal peptidase II [Terriglobales bacterium]|nr:signal peptidase II [Terriglobales bacterium]